MGSMKIIVTGANGFVGPHLVREVHSRGHEVIGIAHSGEVNPDLIGLLAKFIECDLTNEEEVAKLPLEDVDAIINLAGLANVGASFDKPDLYMRVNVDILRVIGERLIEAGSHARVIAVSTGAVYQSDQPLPLTEESVTVTQGSPYSLSKLAMEEEGKKLKEQGLDLAIVRPFNHAGPGQASGFLLPDLLKGLMEAKDTGKPLMVGNLNSRRDYTDVRDVVKAYADLAEIKSLSHTIYNVCSGNSRSGQEVLDLFLDNTGLRNKVEIKVDQSRIRPNDPPELYGSHKRINHETGWQPTIPFEKTISDIVNTN